MLTKIKPNREATILPVEQAATLNASDIHLETQSDGVRTSGFFFQMTALRDWVS